MLYGKQKLIAARQHQYLTSSFRDWSASRNALLIVPPSKSCVREKAKSDEVDEFKDA